MSFKDLIILCLLFCCTAASAQSNRRICVMGSSSAYGYFPDGTSRDSAWAFKVKKYYKNLNLIDTLFNIATNGINCYIGMPSSYIPPPGRDLPNSEFNITRAVNLIPKPTVILVNFPSNGYVQYSIPEILYCLQTIKDSANANGITCFVTTSQPRDDFNAIERQKLSDIRDAIVSQFGLYAIDFYTDIVNTADLKRKPVYAAADLVHLNPQGHTVLADKVIQKNFFFAPVAAHFLNTSARRETSGIHISWEVADEFENSRFIIERSFNGVNFMSVGDIPSRGNSNHAEVYHFTTVGDTRRVFYRVASVSLSGQKLYSNLVAIQALAEINEDLVYPTRASTQITILPSLTSTSGKTRVSILDQQGKVLYNQNLSLQINQPYNIPVHTLATGSYVLQISREGHRQSTRFIKVGN